MSAKPCNKCGQLIVFGQLWDQSWVALTNIVECYRVIKGQQVKKDEGTFIRHALVCPGEPASSKVQQREAEQTSMDLPQPESERYPT